MVRTLVACMGAIGSFAAFSSVAGLDLLAVEIPRLQSANVHNATGASDSGASRLPSGTRARQRSSDIDSDVFFVAGSSNAVMFRVDLAAGTLSSRSEPRLVTGVRSMHVSKTTLWVCQSNPSQQPTLVGFDLATGDTVDSTAPSNDASSELCAKRAAPAAGVPDLEPPGPSASGLALDARA